MWTTPSASAASAVGFARLPSVAFSALLNFTLNMFGTLAMSDNRRDNFRPIFFDCFRKRCASAAAALLLLCCCTEHESSVAAQALVSDGIEKTVAPMNFDQKTTYYNFEWWFTVNDKTDYDGETKTTDAEKNGRALENGHEHGRRTTEDMTRGQRLPATGAVLRAHDTEPPPPPRHDQSVSPRSSCCAHARYNYLLWRARCYPSVRGFYVEFIIFTR